MLAELIRPTVDDVVTHDGVLDDLKVFEQQVYWRQSSSTEDGRSVIVRLMEDGTQEVITPLSFDVRSGVQGYGGGAFCVNGEVIYFVNYLDQRIYRQSNLSAPTPITPEGKYAHGDLIFDCKRQRIICIREAEKPDQVHPETQIVAVYDNKEKRIDILVEDADFYASPRISPCGRYLAWVCWNFPHMPWSESSLELGDVGSDGDVTGIRWLAGGVGESVIEPLWCQDSTLLFLFDQTGWWNLYMYRENTGIRAILNMKAEFGFPPYLLGLHTYASENFASSKMNYIYAAVYINGKQKLIKVACESSEYSFVNTKFENIRYLQVDGNALWFIGTTARDLPHVIKFDLRKHYFNLPVATLVKPTFTVTMPKHIQYPSNDGLTVFAILYLPESSSTTNILPPLIINIHGGPTGTASAAFNPSIQFWTKRGYAYLDVNHRGSTGYGRDYRELLNKNWGIAEVQDCVAGVLYLKNLELIDQNRVAIRGNSAGGYTTLCAITQANCFAAATCYYGISDLGQLWKNTHKFESQYLHQLIGPYPDNQNIFEQRSPINQVSKIETPVLFLQGALDNIVPPSQTRAMASSITKSGKTAIHLEFNEEGHGFRKSSTRSSALLAECYFYSRIFQIPFKEHIDEEMQILIDGYFQNHNNKLVNF